MRARGRFAHPAQRELSTPSTTCACARPGPWPLLSGSARSQLAHTTRGGSRALPGGPAARVRHQRRLTPSRCAGRSSRYLPLQWRPPAAPSSGRWPLPCFCCWHRQVGGPAPCCHLPRRRCLPSACAPTLARLYLHSPRSPQQPAPPRAPPGPAAACTSSTTATPLGRSQFTVGYHSADAMSVTNSKGALSPTTATATRSRARACWGPRARACATPRSPAAGRSSRARL